MAEEQQAEQEVPANDVSDSQVVADANVEEGQVVTDQGVEHVADADNQQVPFSRFKEANDARKVAESEVASLRQQVAYADARQQASQKPQDAFGQDGLDEDDPITVGQARRYRQQERAQDSFRREIDRQDAFIQRTSDFGELVGVLGPNRRLAPSETFVKVMAADPSLQRDWLNGALTPQAACRAAKGFIAQEKLATMQKAAKEQGNIRRADLKTGPLSSSAVGGTGAVSQGSLGSGHDLNTEAGRAAVRAKVQAIEEG